MPSSGFTKPSESLSKQMQASSPSVQVTISAAHAMAERQVSLSNLGLAGSVQTSPLRGPMKPAVLRITTPPGISLSALSPSLAALAAPSESLFSLPEASNSNNNNTSEPNYSQQAVQSLAQVASLVLKRSLAGMSQPVPSTPTEKKALDRASFSPSALAKQRIKIFMHTPLARLLCFVTGHLTHVSSDVCLSKFPYSFFCV
jgi:hypothetical protein